MHYNIYKIYKQQVLWKNVAEMILDQKLAKKIKISAGLGSG